MHKNSKKKYESQPAGGVTSLSSGKLPAAKNPIRPMVSGCRQKALSVTGTNFAVFFILKAKVLVF
jgi:hypothetical protein